ncbi:hypothetical protein SK224_07995 [Microbacterium sp. BG28]|uniref:hypothetical protein n=1 Tax=Microbacterium sp. BG28 TaxID=3097356 RepID=UPI002A5A2C09|nr:hypothetical protein [Microbacterium sp. BG28]MDY0829068.1 hypothetical protein [Microbacterium sp. BG28]
MSNVLEFPTREPESPVLERATVSGVLESARSPRHGDFVFSVQYRGPAGGVTFTAPGTGFVQDVKLFDDHTMTITYAGGVSVTARGDARLTWYPAP